MKFTIKYSNQLRIRKPVITLIFNFLHEEFVTIDTTKRSGFSIYLKIIDQFFMKLYNQSLSIEDSIVQYESDLEKYYKEIMKIFSEYETSDLCEMLKLKIPSFNYIGCKNDMDGILIGGLRIFLRLLLIEMHKLHHLFNYNIDNEVHFNVSTYTDNGVLNNLCILLL